MQNKDGTQKSKGVVSEQGVGLTDRPIPRTRSQTYVQEKVGTIVRKQFNDRKFYKGEITKYDPVNKFYTIKYKDGDIEEYDHSEIKKYKKKKKEYSKQITQQSTGSKTAFSATRQYDENIFFIPTKACPNPVKMDYRKSQAAFLIQHKYDKLRAEIEKAEMEGLYDSKLGDKLGDGPEFAGAASGRIWDEELNKMCSYRDLITHENAEIRARWLVLGENEFGRLFRGFPPNNIDGIGLDWIRKSEVPNGKKCTYPRHTVAVRPEKEEIYRTRITCGGDIFDYFGDVTTHTASMEMINMH